MSLRAPALVALALAAACGKAPAASAPVPDSASAPVPASASAPAPAKAPSSSAPPSAPAPPSGPLAASLSGKDGLFWVPLGGDFPFEDLMLNPDGSYITHLHARPGAAGTWTLEGTTLTLLGWMGDGTWVAKDVRIDATKKIPEMQAVVDGKPVRFQRKMR